MQKNLFQLLPPLAPGSQMLALFQLSPELAVSAGPRVNVANTVTFYSNIFTGESSNRSETTTSYPLLANAFWSIHRRWDFQTSYRGSFLGEKNGAYDHTVSGQFVHFW